MNIIRWALLARLKWITVELYSRGLSEYLGTTSLKPFSDSFGSTALVRRLFVRMLVTMWLILVHGKQECLGVGPVCDMGIPRFQHRHVHQPNLRNIGIHTCITHVEEYSIQWLHMGLFRGKFSIIIPWQEGARANSRSGGLWQWQQR